MARYIDADKLIAEYDRVHIGPAGWARKLMVDAPTADVVEVVRCKDCKNYNTNSCDDGFGWCEQMDCGTMDNWYCSCGEKALQRKEDEGK